MERFLPTSSLPVFSQVPIERLHLLPQYIKPAVSSSGKFIQETEKGETKTTCVVIFMRPREEGGCIIITAGSRFVHEVTNGLGMSECEINKT
jgi:hypothetical protein